MPQLKSGRYVSVSASPYPSQSGMGLELLANDLDSGEIDVPMLKRAIIQKSAAAPGAMAQLRAVRWQSTE